MTRRSQSTDVGFGSDSFLDIIANIVGILIILIVIAGVKVARTPLPPVAVNADDLMSSSESDGQVSHNLSDSSSTMRADQSAPPESTDHSEELNESTPLAVIDPGPQVIHASAELIATTNELERLIGELDADLERLASAIDQDDAARMRKTTSLQAKRDELSQLRGRLKLEVAGEEELVHEHRRARSELEKLQAELESARRKPPPRIVELEHRLTSIARVAGQQEVHFRLAAGRISFVPVQQLLDRLRDQVKRQKDWLVKFNRHEGVVGPIDGYSMQYEVQRETLSTIDQLRLGSGTVRIGVAGWKIRRENTLETESVSEALRSGSRFDSVLLSLDADTVITFWVYPDSFDEYRQLREATHRQGFDVAGRPIPQGVPIAGGPRGTRSMAQ